MKLTTPSIILSLVASLAIMQTTFALPAAVVPAAAVAAADASSHIPSSAVIADSPEGLETKRKVLKRSLFAHGEILAQGFSTPPGPGSPPPSGVTDAG
ncbi:hypothetical protein BGX23_009159, partial [Mortierella sp. AD031]